MANNPSRKTHPPIAAGGGIIFHLNDNLLQEPALKLQQLHHSGPAMCKILIVDDSGDIRRLLRAAIEGQPDWAVCGEAENGKIGVELVSTLRPHLVILDLSMPVMNGLDAAREISAIAPDLPMIMFTMHESETLLKDARRVGIKHVFSKAKGFSAEMIVAMRVMLQRRASTYHA